MIEIDLDFVLALLAVLSAAGGMVMALFRLMRRLEKVEEVSGRSARDVKVIYKGVFACLDGLKQLGANGNVTMAHNMMREHAVEE